MAKINRRTFLVGTAIAATGCTTQPFSKTYLAQPGTHLGRKRVQIYSFLDIRERELGPQLLVEIDQQLAKAFQAASVTTQNLRFKDSDPGKYISSTNMGMQIPVREAVQNHLPFEFGFSAGYRLVIFPSQVIVADAWKYYDIKWDLYDAKTGKLVWRTTSHNDGPNDDENPQARAQALVDGVMNELRASQLL